MAEGPSPALGKMYYNIPSRAAQSNSVYLNVLRVEISLSKAHTLCFAKAIDDILHILSSKCAK